MEAIADKGFDCTLLPLDGDFGGLPGTSLFESPFTVLERLINGILLFRLGGDGFAGRMLDADKTDSNSTSSTRLSSISSIYSVEVGMLSNCGVSLFPAVKADINSSWVDFVPVIVDEDPNCDCDCDCNRDDDDDDDDDGEEEEVERGTTDISGACNRFRLLVCIAETAP